MELKSTRQGQNSRCRVLFLCVSPAFGFLQGASARLFVYITPVPDRQCKNDQFILLDGTDQAVVSYSVSPLPAAVSRQAFSVGSGICAADKVLLDPGFYYLLRISVQLFKFPVKSFRRFYSVAHRSHSFQSSSIGRLFFPSAIYSS